MDNVIHLSNNPGLVFCSRLLLLVVLGYCQFVLSPGHLNLMFRVFFYFVCLPIPIFDVDLHLVFRSRLAILMVPGKCLIVLSPGLLVLVLVAILDVVGFRAPFCLFILFVSLESSW